MSTSKELDIEAIKGRLAAATLGPWEENRAYGSADIEAYGRTIACAVDYIEPEDAQFIAAAPTDIAALLAEVERLNAWVDWLRALNPTRPAFPEVGDL